MCGPEPTSPIEPPSKATLAKYGFGTNGTFVDTSLEHADVADWRMLLALQGGVCGVCGKVPSPNAKTGKVRLVIDHEHVRGWKKMPPEQRRLYVRGLTCWFCNHAYLGRGISVAIAEGVVRYLKTYASRRPA